MLLKGFWHSLHMQIHRASPSVSPAFSKMTILKLGGSAITNKSGWMSANKPAIAGLAGAVAKAWKSGVRNLIIVHGAGSFGHALVIRWKLDNGCKTPAKERAAIKTHEACAKLSSLVVSALKRKGVPAVSIPPIELIVSKNRRIMRFSTGPVAAALKSGKLPVLYGDMVPDVSLGFSVCSGDQIVAYLGKNSSRIVMASKVEGVMADGKLVPLITRRNFASVSRHLGGSSKDVTGGMAGKIKEIMAIRRPAYIVDSRKPSRVTALLLGKKATATKIQF